MRAKSASSTRWSHVLSVALLLSGCSAGGITEVPGVDADNVSLTLSNDGKTAFGDSVTGRVINHGSTSVYLADGCPAVQFSRWNGTQWIPLVN
ncbi:MAG TPA: hypothetical protein VII52_07315, partial [Gemmatimonadaceae bacterium]